MTVRRIKSYTGQTGLVWQYYFVGQRPAIASERANATEYVFDVTSDRHKTTFAVSVFVGREALAQWEAQHGRVLSHTEQYATAKMRLFQAFDEVPDLMASRELEVLADEIETLLEPLDLG